MKRVSAHAGSEGERARAVIVMASDSQIKARRQAGKVWRGKLLFGVSFHVAPGQMEGEREIE